MVDTLDTIYILGNYTEFDRAVDAVARNVRFAIDRNVSVFETNIRIVGGLLSAHAFAEERRASIGSASRYKGELLGMAQDLADRLLVAFESPTGIPWVVPVVRVMLQRANTHQYTHTRVCTRTHARARTHACAHALTHAHAHTRARVHTHTNTMIHSKVQSVARE